MLYRFALSAVAVVSFTMNAFAESFQLDKAKSKIEFVGSKPPKDGKVDSHTGGFKEFDSTLVYNAEKPEDGKFVLEIKAASLTSDNARLTDHLKNPDFFDVKKYPGIRYEATGYEKDKEDEHKGVIKGKLKLLDKTEELDVPFKAEKTEDGVKLIVDFKFDRTKWGMTYGVPNVNADVEVKATLQYKVKK